MLNGCPRTIRLNVSPWAQNFTTAAMFVSMSFSFTVNSIALYYVWNTKLNLFIFSWVMVTEMNVLRVATFYPHLHRTCRPTQVWACGQDLVWNKPAIDEATVNVTQMGNYCKWHGTLNDYVTQLGGIRTWDVYFRADLGRMVLYCHHYERETCSGRPFRPDQGRTQLV